MNTVSLRESGNHFKNNTCRLFVNTVSLLDKFKLVSLPVAL
jgi:hypothetical protein